MDGYQTNSWEKLFERPTTELRFIHYYRNSEDSRYFNIVSKANSAPKIIKEFLTAGTSFAVSKAAAMPELAIPLLAVAGTAIGGAALVGQGINWALKSREAKAALQGMEKFFSAPQVVQRKKAD